MALSAVKATSGRTALTKGSPDINMMKLTKNAVSGSVPEAVVSVAHIRIAYRSSNELRGHPVFPRVSYDEWILGRPLMMEGKCNLGTSKHPTEQWKWLQRWATTLRVSAEIKVEIRVFEMYVSYLFQNDMYRFASEWSDSLNGGWWTQQLASFVKGLRDLQHITLTHLLIPEQDQRLSRPRGPSVGMTPRRWSPFWGASCCFSMLRLGVFFDGWNQETHVQVEVSFQGVEEWRHLTMGMPNRQMRAQGKFPSFSYFGRSLNHSGEGVRASIRCLPQCSNGLRHVDIAMNSSGLVGWGIVSCRRVLLKEFGTMISCVASQSV